MLRPALAVVLCLAGLGRAVGQDYPINIPQPMGGPIVGRDGKIRTGLDAHPVASPWNWAVDLGLSGSQGNTDTLKLRTGLDLRYDTPDDVMILNVLYILNQANGGELENKGFGLLRNEMPIDDTFGWYAQTAVEYDEFRTVDFRFASHSGLAFTAYQDASQLLRFRVGFGTAYESGGPVNEWLLEGQAGLDYEYRLTDRTKVTAAADYYPNVEAFGQYRVRVRASFDILLDPQTNVLLRLGAFNRYDSKPYGSQPNDLDYFMTLQFRF
jgi:putative salt-induced outer membrane protein YdiY